MVRSLAFGCVVILALACSSVAYADIHDSAPADEYFGPFKESVLGIRNRLLDLERKADSELLIGDATRGIDNVERAIEDWDRHYPRDPWLAGFMDRTLHIYGRAHALGSEGARRCLTLLEHGFPHTTQARDAMSYVGHVERARRGRY
jgi:hypothetical protein